MVILVFMFIFASCTNQNRGDRSKEEIEFQSLSKNSNQLLFNFLRNPLFLEDVEDSTVGDAIGNYFLTPDPDLLVRIKSEAKDFFSVSELEGDNLFWSLEINHLTEKVSIESGSTRGFVAKKTLSVTTLPTTDPDKTIEVKMFIFYTQFTT
tara:strand:+ start:581 stop:1033 length:453 start_codon:yes stop_codon:yes gene_type:complete